MDPKNYDRGSRFAEIQSANPNKPTPGLKLDQEFDKIKSAIDAIGQALGVITRDDGALDNGSVGRDQISSDVSLGFDPPATWEVGKYYRDGKDTCFHASKFWRCEESHSSEEPFDETKWSMVADFAEATTAAETAKIAAEAARDLVLGYKQDAETAATSAETSKNTAETKATEASQSAVSASNSAQTATTKAAETTQDRSDVATMKTAAETARDQAEAARDAAQAAQPISASVKGRELVAKATEAEMRTVLGAASVQGLQGKSDSGHNHDGVYVKPEDLQNPILTKFYESGELTMTPNSEISLAHGLGAIPRLIIGVMICKIAEYGFSVGDEFHFPLGRSSNYTTHGQAVKVDDTNIKLRLFGGVPPSIARFDATYTAESPTPANWKIKLRAYR